MLLDVIPGLEVLIGWCVLPFLHELEAELLGELLHRPHRIALEAIVSLDLRSMLRELLHPLGVRALHLLVGRFQFGFPRNGGRVKKRLNCIRNRSGTGCLSSATRSAVASAGCVDGCS